MKVEEDGVVKLSMILPLTPDENAALKKKVDDSGMKQYCFVREAVLKRLREENYLPNPQM